MTGWITDVIRLGWGALYWNIRKTLHTLRKRTRGCPCQVSSDSGRAMATGCEAVTQFRSPGRFRVVCPLLVRRDDGRWVCSVDADKIRPFWGRAALLWGGGCAAGYVGVTLGAFLLLLALGYHPTYRQVAYPPAWPELRVVQSRRYLEISRQARAAGRPSEAILALANAYELNPRDYSSGLLLAQLRQATHPTLADEVYSRLYRDHPERREATAQAWYRALLARGDFSGIVPLARDRLLVGEQTAVPAWAQALLFALRRVGDTRLPDELAASEKLAPGLRELFRLEARLPAETEIGRVRLLADAAASTHEPFAALHLLRRLLDELRADLVLPLLAAPDCPLSEQDKIRLRLDALATHGRTAERAALLRQLNSIPANPAVWELVSSHLVAHPEPTLLALVAEARDRDPLPTDAAHYPQFLAWFVACGVHRDAGRIDAANTLLAAVAGRDTLALQHIRKAFLEGTSALRPEAILPFLHSLPLQTLYAFHDRHAPPPPYPG